MGERIPCLDIPGRSFGVDAELVIVKGFTKNPRASLPDSRFFHLQLVLHHCDCHLERPIARHLKLPMSRSVWFAPGRREAERFVMITHHLICFCRNIYAVQTNHTNRM